MALLDAMITGAIAGGVYGLLALGLALQYGVARILNLAYGEAVALGGILTALLYQGAGMSPLLCLLLLPPLFTLGHLFLHRWLFLPLLGRRLAVDGEKEGRVILLTFGLSFLVQGLLAAELGGRLFSYSFLGQGVALGPSAVALNRLLAFALGLVLVVAVHLFLNRTRLGTAVRALSREPEEALLVGVPAPRLSAWVFALGGGVAAATGVLLSMFQALAPSSGPELTLKALVVVILGGLGGAPGALAGGMVLGMAEGLVARFLNPGLSLAAVYGLFVLAVWYLRGKREEARQ
ncbi:MAG: branched-chain amino acid ABC transporter permease [Thermus sp.]|uniref:branched-chain amino acid ABC transporter permease n=1 Tax=unclassified Thermus TaxID=2619321 RepID=UPI00023895C5|nr:MULTISPECIES: branched-chain amino acid ABC transporter permease [unclassified Thermus]AEV16340.1 ABC transporter, permease protein [Thermus sp. CCB_US3_UF1]MCS6868157.1 branched-chain amino acid ABC transporter permease [Thermus sp.]MCS7219146.1 branched-chain amino acid ABC transporter permease [Thermus sp.]MCX7849476.1 branched-chain amino acid ABC transporter permease [Thermus sp.]MDW8017518.1 branched-chain amino acid ABC transporter permease [Thermus sp.]